MSGGRAVRERARGHSRQARGAAPPQEVGAPAPCSRRCAGPLRRPFRGKRRQEPGQARSASAAAVLRLRVSPRQPPRDCREQARRPDPALVRRCIDNKATRPPGHPAGPQPAAGCVPAQAQAADWPGPNIHDQRQPLIVPRLNDPAQTHKQLFSLGRQLLSGSFLAPERLTPPAGRRAGGPERRGQAPAAAAAAAAA